MRLQLTACGGDRSVEGVGSGARGEAGIGQVVETADQERVGALHEQELPVPGQSPHFIRQEQTSPRLRAGYGRSVLTVRMQAATHAGRPVLARYANRGLARHLRKIFGRVPVVRPEGLEHVSIGKEGGPGLAVRAPQLRQVLKNE